jgi:acylphosphatase
MNVADKVEIHAIISGLVQGVGFRATARHIAQRLDLKGSVRNLPDGNVEIIIQGSPTQLQLFFETLQTETHGRIDSIQKIAGPLSKQFIFFSIS